MSGCLNSNPKVEFMTPNFSNHRVDASREDSKEILVEIHEKIKPKREYWSKKGKTEEEIAEHEKNKRTKHNAMMNKNYQSKTELENNNIYVKYKKLCDKVAISPVDLVNEIKNLTVNKLQTRCFQELCKSIDPVPLNLLTQNEKKN